MMLLTMPTQAAPFLGLPPVTRNFSKSSEAIAKNPPCGEAKTAQLMRQEIYELFDGASIETD